MESFIDRRVKGFRKGSGSRWRWRGALVHDPGTLSSMNPPTTRRDGHSQLARHAAGLEGRRAAAFCFPRTSCKRLAATLRPGGHHRAGRVLADDTPEAIREQSGAPIVGRGVSACARHTYGRRLMAAFLTVFAKEFWKTCVIVARCCPRSCSDPFDRYCSEPWCRGCSIRACRIGRAVRLRFRAANTLPAYPLSRVAACAAQI